MGDVLELREAGLLILAGVAVGWRLHASPATTVIVAALLAGAMLVERSPDRSAGVRSTDLVHFGLTTALVECIAAITLPALDRAGVVAELAWPFQVVVLLLLVDGLAYATHRLMHASDLAFRFHAVHHGDGGVDSVMAFRRHPGDEIVQRVPLILAIAALGPSPSALLVAVGLATVWGLMIHANLRLPGERGLAHVVITPGLHHRHHADGDVLFGGMFTVWDRVLRTWPSSATRTVRHDVAPLPARPFAAGNSWLDQLVAPFRGGS